MPGDVVKASVLSLGDAIVRLRIAERELQLFLSTVPEATEEVSVDMDVVAYRSHTAWLFA